MSLVLSLRSLLSLSSAQDHQTAWHSHQAASGEAQRRRAGRPGHGQQAGTFPEGGCHTTYMAQAGRWL